MKRSRVTPSGPSQNSTTTANHSAAKHSNIAATSTSTGSRSAKGEKNITKPAVKKDHLKQVKVGITTVWTSLCCAIIYVLLQQGIYSKAVAAV